MMKYSKIIDLINDAKKGKMFILVDDENRENEGDLVFCSSDTSSNKINFMAKYGRGLICLTLDSAQAKKLGLSYMSPNNQSRNQTAFTVSIEAKKGVTTGISAQDRAHTIQVAISDMSEPHDLVVPGHIFPLKAKKGGVLERAGHTEGSVDLMRLAGKKPASVICEILKDDGTMARLADLSIFCEKYEIPLISIKDLIDYRLSKEQMIKELGSKQVDTSYGSFEGVWFKSLIDGCIHFVLLKGREKFENNCVEVRVHKQKPILDVFSSEQEDEGSGLNPRKMIKYGLKMLKDSKRAALIYLQDPSGFDFDCQMNMDPRAYGIGAQIIKKLKIKKMCLHAASKKQLVALEGFGIVVEKTKLIKS